MLAYLSGATDTCKHEDTDVRAIDNEADPTPEVAFTSHADVRPLLAYLRLHDRVVLFLQLHAADVPAQDLLHLLHQQDVDRWLGLQVRTRATTTRQTTRTTQRNQECEEEEEVMLEYNEVSMRTESLPLSQHHQRHYQDGHSISLVRLSVRNQFLDTSRHTALAQVSRVR